MIEVSIFERVATVTLAREPVNAMNDAWVQRFHDVLDGLERRDDWSVLHIRSALKLFSGGADLKQIKENFQGTIEVQLGPGRRYQELFARIEALPFITIAELRGMALGGGLELALACDVRVAADNARLGLPEVKLGLMPGAGGTQRLPRLVGRATAMRMILSGEAVSGAEALSLGLVQWVASADELEERTAALARQFAAIEPHAARAAKAAIGAAFQTGRDGYEVETDNVRACLENGRTRELVSAFLARAK
jgi:enoyl-CoA hydratase